MQNLAVGQQLPAGPSEEIENIDQLCSFSASASYSIGGKLAPVSDPHYYVRIAIMWDFAPCICMSRFATKLWGIK